MISNVRTWLATLFLVLGFVSPAAALPLPPFQCPWCEDSCCPRPSYCCLHYLVPSIYTCRAYHTPPRYVYGCAPPPGVVGFRVTKYPCFATSPEEQADKYIEVGRGKSQQESVTSSKAESSKTGETPTTPPSQKSQKEETSR
jgi:hypothetical protein